MNETDLEGLLEHYQNGTTWVSKCVDTLLKSGKFAEITEGLVTQHGSKPVEFLKDAWNARGIDIATCYEYCSRQNFPMVFDFTIFASGVTNYLLPWLGLTAQLPYETGTVSGNFESFCLAVGSPMLTTFSLMSTNLNAHSTSKIFDAKFGNGKTESEMKTATEAAEYFLCGSQQSPIRIKEDIFRELFDEEPARLCARWKTVKDRLHNTRRQYTFSLVAQASIAIIAWFLTIVGSAITSLGKYSDTLLLTSGTLWTWLIPVVLGWMTVGVQYREDAVRDAIKGEERNSDMKALEAVSGFPDRPPQTYEALLGDVQGDEKQQGPAYNYARILTYPKLRDRVVSAFEEKLRLINQPAIPVVEDVVPTPEANTLQVETVIHKQDPASSSAPDSTSAISQASTAGCQKPQHTNTVQLETAPAIDPATGDGPYMTWQEVTSSSEWIKNFLLSNIVAFVLQWGVTGSAVVISYLTEVRGLGCRSGSYLIYGILATFAHILLLTSVFLSHGAMLFYQSAHKTPSQTTKATPQTRGARHKLFCVLAVATRYLGKSLAVSNTIWIILSSVFELIGFYDSCWCTGVVLGLGDKAWIPLFPPDDRKMRTESQASWTGGLMMSVITLLWTYFLTEAYSWGRKH